MAMGDTACLMHAFSYTCTSGLSNEPKQGNGNPTNALGESVSFGRFVSESLSWEKWSAFSHNNNRYVEEAERYSQPGSVAQKKAFFEAHYKRIAAAKKAAAALLEEEEEASAANNNATETPPPPPPPADGTSIVTQSQASDSYAAALHQPQEHGQEPDLQSGSMKEAETPLEIIVKEDEMHTGLEVSSGTPKLEKPQLSVRVHPKKQASNSTKSFDIQDDTSASENSGGTPQIEKPLLKVSASSRDAPPSVNSKKKSAFSSFKSSIYPKTSKIPSPSPAKMVPSRIKKEQKTIPIANKPTLQYTEKKQSKKPLFAYTDSTTPARTPERLFAPSNAKTPNTRVGSAAYRAFQACMSPLRTPNTAASARMSKNVSTTPQPDNTRINPPRDGSRTATPKWKILSAVCSKSLAANRNKLQSPTVSTPFTLRTEERAARRKQKLEEKFNLKETPKDQLQTKIKTPKVQLQTKIKEKAENELRKLRRSFCFNARPPPNFSKQRRETTENHNTKKGTTTQAQSSSKLGKKLSSNGPSISCGPSIMNKSYNKPINTSSSPATTTSHFISSSAGATNHENTSPNIRYY